MTALLIILVFLTVGLAVFAFGAAAFSPASVLAARLRTLGWQRPEAPRKPPLRERLAQVIEPLSHAIPLTAADLSRTRTWLIQAGYRDPRVLTVYLGVRTLLAFLCLMFVIGIGQYKNVALMVGFPAFGFLLPRFALKRAITRRQHRITLGLPDALDLTVICVEAGLALDQALMRVGEDLRPAHPDLSVELYLATLEMRAGKPRAEALRNLAARTGVDDLRALVATLVQTDRFGTSVTQALRVHSDSLRTQRRQRAEEQAAKTTIKMVMPLVIFVMPSIIFVTLGPAIIQLVRTLIPAGR
jgi:tight adherence protein C